MKLRSLGSQPVLLPSDIPICETASQVRLPTDNTLLGS